MTYSIENTIVMPNSGTHRKLTLFQIKKKILAVRYTVQTWMEFRWHNLWTQNFVIFYTFKIGIIWLYTLDDSFESIKWEKAHEVLKIIFVIKIMGGENKESIRQENYKHHTRIESCLIAEFTWESAGSSCDKGRRSSHVKQVNGAILPLKINVFWEWY